MDIHQALEIILRTTFAKSDVYARLVLLRDYLEEHNYSVDPHDSNLTEILVRRYAGTLFADAASSVAAWGSDVISFFATPTGAAALQELLTHVLSLPELTVYLPTPFTPEQVGVLGGWCRANVDPQVLIELRVDPRAAGGCFFVWKDRYYDFSLSYFLAKQQKEIMDLVDRYAVTPLSTAPALGVL